MNTNRLLLTDVSFYEAPIDFNKMKSAGVKATIVRAGQNLWTDPSFRQFWFDAKKAGLWRGSYWFWDSRVSPQKQAELWIDLMQGDLGELPLFVDLEEHFNGQYKGTENIKLFMEELKRLAPNKEQIIYTGYYWWIENVSTSYNDYFKQYDIWLADYDSEPSVPRPFSKWLIWQFDDKGSGEKYGCKGGAVDLNYFNGNEEEFMARFKLEKLEDLPPETNEDKLISVKDYYDGIKIYHKEASLPQGKTKYHLVEIDPTKVEFFVSPQLTSRMYVPKFVDKYELALAINGDGFVSTKIAGYAISEGKPYGKKAIEETLYISKDNKITLNTGNKETWNAISFPNRLVYDGEISKINKTRDDIRGRSAIGFTKDQKKIYLIAVDGKDYWSKEGMNFWEVAERLQALGCDFAGMFDGGGSTTLSVKYGGKAEVLGVPCGEDDVFGYKYPMRRVANVFGIRVKTAEIISEPDEEVKPIDEVKETIVLEEGDYKLMKKYKILEPVKARKTPSMYQVVSKNVTAGTEFESDMEQVISERIPLVGGTVYNINWVKLPDGYWIPSEYKGINYVKEVSVVEVITESPKFPDEVGIILKMADGTLTEPSWYIKK